MTYLSKKARESKELRAKTEAELVIATKVMRYNEADALRYLEEKGYPMSYGKYKSIVKKQYSGMEKQVAVLGYNFSVYHMEKITKLREVERKYWETYEQLDPLDRIKVLKEIAQLQPLISAYEELTVRIQEQETLRRAKQLKQDFTPLPESSIIEKPKEVEITAKSG